MAVLGSNLVGQVTHLLRVEMVDGNCNANAAKLRDEIGRLLDRFSAVVLGAMRACAAAGADDRRASFAEGCCDTVPGPACGAGDHGHSITERRTVR